MPPSLAKISVPFDAVRLDGAMDRAGVDLVLASSRHNVRYLLGGYQSHRFGLEPALGVSKYEPLVGYVAGDPSSAFFIGNRADLDGFDAFPVWIADRVLSGTDIPSNWEPLEHAIRSRGLERARIAVELEFVSAATQRTLDAAFSGAQFVEALPLLEHLRAIKSPHEIETLRMASELVIEAMLAVFGSIAAGDSSLQIADRVAAEERARGLAFGYCHVALGTEVNRVPSAARLRADTSVSLDSGATLRGYAGDVARMGIAGHASASQRRALEEVDQVQHAVAAAIAPGITGADLYAAADEALAACTHAGRMDFMSHGLGLITHELPRIAPPHGNPHRYPDSHRHIALEPGMVLSIETTLRHPKLGFLKLGDAVAVTEAGGSTLGGGGRGWNRIEAAG